jgi:hypothetical protein
VLTLKHSRANAGTRDIGTINSNNRIAATVYSLGILFVSGIGGGGDDNDNNNNNIFNCKWAVARWQWL